MAQPRSQLCWTSTAFLAVLLSTAAPAAEEPAFDKLYETGKALFDQFAPEEVKEEYEFPSKDQWDEFAARLQQALQSENLAELAAYEDEARTALQALRLLPGYEDYADWLQERIDYMEAADQVSAKPPAAPVPAPGPAPTGASLDSDESLSKVRDRRRGGSTRRVTNTGLGGKSWWTKRRKRKGA